MHQENKYAYLYAQHIYVCYKIYVFLREKPEVKYDMVRINCMLNNRLAYLITFNSISFTPFNTFFAV